MAEVYIGSYCGICSGIYVSYHCDKCNINLCPKCVKHVTYIRQGQNVNGVETSPMLSSTVKLDLCPKCYEKFDPIN